MPTEFFFADLFPQIVFFCSTVLWWLYDRVFQKTRSNWQNRRYVSFFLSKKVQKTNLGGYRRARESKSWESRARGLGVGSGAQDFLGFGNSSRVKDPKGLLLLLCMMLSPDFSSCSLLWHKQTDCERLKMCFPGLFGWKFISHYDRVPHSWGPWGNLTENIFVIFSLIKCPPPNAPPHNRPSWAGAWTQWTGGGGAWSEVNSPMCTPHPLRQMAKGADYGKFDLENWGHFPL